MDWAGDPWHALTGGLKAATGRKGKPLFLPLRRALTGRDSGPDMEPVLPLIGRARARERQTTNSNQRAGHRPYPKEPQDLRMTKTRMNITQQQTPKNRPRP